VNDEQLQQAVSLHQTGRLVEAEQLYLRWLDANPGHTDGMYFLAGLHHQRGKPKEAVRLFRLVLERDAGRAAAWLNLGVSHKALGDLEQAQECFGRAVALQPDLATAHFNLGVVLQERERHAQALQCFDRALGLRPEYAKAHSNRSTVLASMKRYEEALASAERAIALMPTYVEAHNNRGSALNRLNRLEEALQSYERALALAPANFDANCNRAQALSNLNRLEEAESSYQRALAVTPLHSDANWNQGITKLRLGRLETAWAQYEFRWKLQGAPPYRHGSMPQWHRDVPVAGRRVLVWYEQGLGDTLQFCRYVQLLAARGAQVVLEVQRPLKKLMQSLSGVAELLDDGEPARSGCDLQSPLLSLPMAFDTRLSTIPAEVPYLAAEPELVTLWRARLLDTGTKPRVGIACSGNPAHTNDSNRSIPLRAFAPLYERAQLYLLQNEVRAEDEAELLAGPVVDLRGMIHDFADTAAIVENLDLVISVDTSLVHLAGAMAKPVWILVPWLCDWRWMLERTDSPWYPSARLFRQPGPGRWDEVLAAVAAELAGPEAHQFARDPIDHSLPVIRS